MSDNPKPTAEYVRGLRAAREALEGERREAIQNNFSPQALGLVWGIKKLDEMIAEAFS